MKNAIVLLLIIGYLPAETELDSFLIGQELGYIEGGAINAAQTLMIAKAPQFKLPEELMNIKRSELATRLMAMENWIERHGDMAISKQHQVVLKVSSPNPREMYKMISRERKYYLPSQPGKSTLR